MNREIKFRAWDYFNEVMIYDSDDESDFKFYNGKCIVKYVTEQHTVENGIDIDRPVWNQVDGPVMQYIGIKDNNSKGIYEGDIKLWEFNNIKQVSVCYWSDTDCGFRWKLMKHNEKKSQVELGVLFDNEEDYYNYVLECNQRQNGFDSFSKIIGNIYENPELLTNK